MNGKFDEESISAPQQAISGEDELGEALKLGISGDTTITLQFDGNGNAAGGISKTCVGFTIHIDAYMDSCPEGSVFDVKLDTDYPEHFSWSGIAVNQHITQSIKTKVVGKTSIKVSVHSNKPNTSATAHIHYST